MKMATDLFNARETRKIAMSRTKGRDLMKRITLAAALALPLFLGTTTAALAAKIAVIGTGNVGSALGPEFAALGHTIVYGSRTPNEKDVQDLVATDRARRDGHGAGPRPSKAPTSSCSRFRAIAPSRSREASATCRARSFSTRRTWSTATRRTATRTMACRAAAMRSGFKPRRRTRRSSRRSTR